MTTILPSEATRGDAIMEAIERQHTELPQSLVPRDQALLDAIASHRDGGYIGPVEAEQLARQYIESYNRIVFRSKVCTTLYVASISLCFNVLSLFGPLRLKTGLIVVVNVIIILLLPVLFRVKGLTLEVNELRMTGCVFAQDVPGEQCAICLDTIHHNDPVLAFRTPCNHTFHFHCIQQSFKSGIHSCPLCRECIGENVTRTLAAVV